MPWFIVDDGFHAHKKTVRAGVGAIGLWTLAGSWSADQLTDGWIPDYVAARLDPDYLDHAHALVRAGLWIEDERDGDKGWFFHEWEQRQQMREDVLAKREAARVRVARARANKKARSQPVRANTTGTPDEVRGLFALPDTYTYTDTEEPSYEGSEDAPDGAPKRRKPERPIPDDFTVTADMREWAAAKHPGIKVDVETPLFIEHAHANDRRQRDWNAAWRKWIGNQAKWNAERAAPSLPASNAPRAIPTDEMCTRHRGKRARNCGECRAERLAGGAR